MNSLKHILNKHRLEAFVVLFLIVVAVLYFSNGTMAQTPIYTRGETNNPTCGPNDSDCGIAFFETIDQYGDTLTTNTFSFEFTGDGVMATELLGAVTVSIPGGSSPFTEGSGTDSARQINNEGFFDAGGDHSIALGSGEATGDYSTAMGRFTTADAYASLVMGRYNVISGTTDSWVSTDPLFVIGNGAIGLPSNAVTVLKNGNVGIGTTSPGTSNLLELSSTSKGFVLPRMTKVQRNAISSPVEGMMIYQTDETQGLRVYNGTNWMKFAEAID